jgi:dipeptidyl aminopeptidase/acylaminoacyl peptidase
LTNRQPSLKELEMRRNFRPHCFTASVSAPTVRLAVACAVVLAVILTATGSARAAFPGANGAISFTRCTPGLDCQSEASYQIWLMEADGSGQHQVVQDPGFFAGYSSFSADGRWIAFQRCTGDPADPRCGIAKVDAHGQNSRNSRPWSQIRSAAAGIAVRRSRRMAARSCSKT